MIPSTWSLRHGKFQMKQHSGVASGVVLTVESGVGQKLGKVLMRATKAEEAAITVSRKRMDPMATSTWKLSNGAMRLSILLFCHNPAV